MKVEYLGVAVAMGEPALALGGLDVAHEAEALVAEQLPHTLHVTLHPTEV